MHLFIHYTYIHDDWDLGKVHAVSLSDFEAQVRQLKEEYQLVTVSDYLIHNREEPCCCLTFDDGIIDHYTHVLPVLEKYGMKATFYPCSAPVVDRVVLPVHKIHLLAASIGYSEFMNQFIRLLPDGVKREAPVIDILQSYPYDTDAVRRFKLDLNYLLPYRIRNAALSQIFSAVFSDEGDVVKRFYMNECQIREIQANGHEVGWHSHEHNILSRLSDDDLAIEMDKSIALLQQLDIDKNWTASYPFAMLGTFDDRAINHLQGSGCIGALTMVKALNTGSEDAFYINRYDVNDVFYGGKSIK